MAQQTDKLYLVENKNTIRKLASLRSCGQLTDLQFVFPDGSQIDAHKAIVAQYSSVIAAKCVDIDQHKLQILSTDIDNEEMIEPNVMNIMLDYIYGQQVTILRDNIQQVMRLAIKLNVPEFLADCDNILFQNKPPVDKITGSHIKQEVTELGYDSQLTRPSGRGRSGNSVSASKNLNKESPALKRTGTKRTIKKAVPEYVEPELDDIDDGMDDTMDNDDEEDTDEYEPDVEFKDENDDANYIDDTSATPRKRQKSSSKKEKKGEEANVNPLVCELCDKTFETHKESAEHQRDVHNTIACDICAKVFNNEPDLRRHGVLHTGEVIPQAPPAEEVSPSAPQAYGFQFTLCYKCEVCSKLYSTEEALKIHSQKLHGVKLTDCKTMVKCDSCGLLLVDKQAYKQHIITNQKCADSCTITSSSYYAVQTAVCEYCSDTYHPGDLTKHLRLKHDGYKCYSCGLQCTNKEILTRHYIGNTKCADSCPKYINFHICDKCGKIYSRKCSLEAHIVRNHSDENVPCSICNQTFQSNYHLKMHHKRVHDKKVQCEHCGKSFGMPQDLKEHVRIHTGERPYKCEICDKSFAQGGSLYKHKQSQAHINKQSELDNANGRQQTYFQY